jgi:hypothetical protein
MKKIKPYFSCMCLCFFLLVLHTFEVRAVPIGGITKILKGIGKGSKLVKPGTKLTTPNLGDDFLKKINKSDTSTDVNSNILLNKNSSHDDILNAHGIRRLNKIVDGKDVAEVTSETLLDDTSNDGLINTFRVMWWTGRAFRASNIFNEPQLSERLIIECPTDNDVFTFTALLSNKSGSKEKKKNWFLLSNHFPNAKIRSDGSISIKPSTYYQPSMPKQELFVLADNDDYIIFSNEILEGKKYPTKYFVISSNAKFIYALNVYGTESPEYIKDTAKIKLEESNFSCLRKNI